MKVNAAPLAEGIVAVEPRDATERLPLGALPRALSLFQHFDHQLFDLRIQLFERSLPAHRSKAAAMPVTTPATSRSWRLRRSMLTSNGTEILSAKQPTSGLFVATSITLGF